jgi:hypothetical protein
MLHQARKKQKQKNRKTQLAASGSRQAEGRNKSCIPGVEYIHILFIYIVVRNDAKQQQRWRRRRQQEQEQEGITVAASCGVKSRNGYCA